MDPFLSPIAKGFLFFSHETVIAPLIFCGFITLKKSIWGNAIFVLLFTMVFSAFLKSLFLVPLNPALKIEGGFAFPSGHVQAATAFYGWLFLMYPHFVIRSGILLILAGISFGIIQQGYHNFVDVLGAIAFGGLTIYAFLKITSFSFFRKNPARLGLCLLPLLGMMMGVLFYRTGIPSPVWKALFILTGFTFSWLLCYRTLPETMTIKMLTLTACILSGVLVFITEPLGLLGWKLTASFFGRTPLGLVHMPWFFVSASLPLSLALSHLLMMRWRKS